ncbi:uncharacterized protein OCT59_016450 [Rhizophagus irregularis]|uniref:uncharacterized protein n=1 Tax=Rhizophagus irregularis TaxID=588596 RepID=UPI0019FAEAD8|nr:hypothetical protein OCT59_016450 [Rhizophagus irregularis]GBC31524.2 serine/threonine-protein kinase [Rhizophagus irregularis DAOM 181602=DAOM 197198]
MSTTSTSTNPYPSYEEIKKYDTEQLLTFLQKNLTLSENVLTTLRQQKVAGLDFFQWTKEMLRNKPYNLPDGPATRLVMIVNDLNRNTQNSTSVYRFVRKQGIFKIWEIEEDPSIRPQRGIGENVFKVYPCAPAQGSNRVIQPFCKDVVSEINEIVKSMHSGSLRVYKDVDVRSRVKDQVYADIIIGHADFHKELTNNPPDLSKGLGWEVKSNLSDRVKASKGKGELIKYAREYLSAIPPLTNVFYGCLTDGRLWQFVKIQLILNDIDNLKVKFEESPTYEWSIETASLIASIILRYHDGLLTRASGESQNNDETYMYRRNKSLFSPESLLASFIKEGIYIRLYSGNCIHVQITSHLGNGKKCIVFLVQVHDYEIRDAVLKIEVLKDSENSQIYREISALHALGDLSCVPTILFEGYTMGGTMALLTDFAGQPLESWISDNDNIDDYTIFQIILDLLSCLEKIHTRGYTHGDVAIRNVIQRNGHFYLIDFGLATLLQLLINPCQAIIRDYIYLCRIIGVIKFRKKMSLLELIDKLDGEFKSFVSIIENASRWKIINEEKWLERFGAEVKQFHERGHHLPRKALLDITEI